MKKIFLLLCLSLLLFNSCKKAKTEPSEVMAISEPKTEDALPKTVLTKAFNEYWFNGEAEITSYKLEQARYGELREGTAVLVYVTEDFLPEVQVKADNYSKENIPVLKLNATKNFITGIYPYSIMQSTFYPVANNKHAIKISASIQEWCGHVYTQLNNRDDFEVTSHSYFQGEADQSFTLKKTLTENELWTKLRIDPKSLPVGSIEIIPSIEYLRFTHNATKAYKAEASLENGIYSLYYPELNRLLKINFNASFPHNILGWEETTTSGYGASAKKLTTKATKLESIKSAYWNKKSTIDEALRETLKLQ
ncbi:septum formation inhibitor Maf [Winogradskyella echinorum]|uniref:Septum formation inhibitor Maf n=1 Tax=Winogradskyella echinorum TaxID=538189 RepID=A0ABR6Y1S0_9FLAO|nr:septum formation inhibitor Maf [Winogradskyella echinorum]MBC3846688.1 septum formation inhibitor Maf [Winogradskyella echinorum]MBC5751036.1 septum formation inhibitor Maf [Winogradskyella echinorum]